MAGTCTSIRPRLIGSSSIVELSRLINRVGVPFSVRISTRTRGHGGGLTAPTSREEGPSCIFVGPIDSARKETLEALYRQVRIINLFWFFKFVSMVLECVYNNSATDNSMFLVFMYLRQYLVVGF